MKVLTFHLRANMWFHCMTHKAHATNTATNEKCSACPASNNIRLFTHNSVSNAWGLNRVVSVHQGWRILLAVRRRGRGSALLGAPITVACFCSCSRVSQLAHSFPAVLRRAAFMRHRVHFGMCRACCLDAQFVLNPPSSAGFTACLLWAVGSQHGVQET